MPGEKKWGEMRKEGKVLTSKSDEEIERWGEVGSLGDEWWRAAGREGGGFGEREER